MALEMRDRRERCEAEALTPDGPARICTYVHLLRALRRRDGRRLSQLRRRNAARPRRRTAA
ncbi:hypothetical protein STANM309S_03976 [Streptomyces tanashiensis]